MHQQLQDNYQLYQLQQMNLQQQQFTSQFENDPQRQSLQMTDNIFGNNDCLIAREMALRQQMQHSRDA